MNPKIFTLIMDKMFIQAPKVRGKSLRIKEDCWMMVDRYPNLKEEVSGSIPSYEISSLLDRNLALACRPSVSKKLKKLKKILLNESCVANPSRIWGDGNSNHLRLSYRNKYGGNCHNSWNPFLEF